MNVQTQQVNLRSQLDEAYQHSLPRIYWGAIGRGLARLIGRKTELPLWFSALFMMGITQGVTYLIGVILKDPNLAEVIIPKSLGMLSYSWLCIIIFEGQVLNMLSSMQMDLIDLFDLSADPTPLQGWIRYARSNLFQGFFIISTTLWFTIITINTLYTQRGQPPSLVLYVFFVLVFLQMLSHFCWLALISLVFMFSIRSWKLKLFSDDPASTAALQNLYRAANGLVITITFVIVLNMLAAIPLNLYSEGYVAAMVFVFWLPTLIFFILRESAFSTVVVNAKVQRLKEIQAQIIEIERTQPMVQKEPIEAVKRLLELHNQIKSTPNAMINLNSVINLIASLALPLLATLISLMDVWQKFFKTP